jgi:beta-1,4-N-acetylglucosaminyltransferase
MESLALQKDVIAVINTTLMDNHQIEIAQELSSHRYSAMCHPEALAETISKTNFSSKVMLPAANPYAYVNYIGKLVGLE